MREIKFKFWDIKNKKWVTDEDGVCLFEYDNKHIFEYGLVYIPCQFTGLTDIYGGDNVILTSQMSTSPYPIGTEGVVRFIECGWYVDTGTELIKLWSENYEWTVIGNIHEEK